ncbi:hypothetical protein Pla110_28730 [Polystyrenella longa]|uniref:Uncharacterized protein n=1 Tax=Polystyrenella longa TaxID=2528007 RepID=A0A518CPH9_9PLAN|nr:hypothetical protein [Polystyrenella longa]QDU81136.1 hypothetical protein Pla110_28730 [Polystyrenella longa]
MNPVEMIDLQNRIVVTTANAIETDWDAAVVNLEVDVQDQDLKKDCLPISFQRVGHKWESQEFAFPDECIELFLSSLREATADPTP